MFEEEQVFSATQSIWEAVLGMSLTRDELGMDGIPDDMRAMAGCVQISGDQDIAVVLRCTTELARTLAAAMLCISRDDASVAEIQDALGELTNLVGGTLKNQLSGSTRLSVPAVAEGSHMSFRMAGGHRVCEVDFHCEGEPLQVSVLAKGP